MWCLRSMKAVMSRFVATSYEGVGALDCTGWKEERAALASVCEGGVDVSFGVFIIRSVLPPGFFAGYQKICFDKQMGITPKHFTIICPLYTQLDFSSDLLFVFGESTSLGAHSSRSAPNAT